MHTPTYTPMYTPTYTLLQCTPLRIHLRIPQCFHAWISTSHPHTTTAGFLSIRSVAHLGIVIALRPLCAGVPALPAGAAPASPTAD